MMVMISHGRCDSVTFLIGSETCLNRFFLLFHVFQFLSQLEEALADHALSDISERWFYLLLP